MNSIKRHLFDQLLDKQIKKLRISQATCYTDRFVVVFRRSSITCMENLPNELLYEIFDYLDSYYIYLAFSNLNLRFQHLITSSLLPLKINFSGGSKISLEYLYKNVINPNKDRIRSLHFKNKQFIDEFLTKSVLDSSFNHLQSIIFNAITNDQLQILLPYLSTLLRLISLTIHLERNGSYNFNDIYQMIFHLPVLKYNKLSLLDTKQSNLIVPSIVVNTQFSTIEYLIIDHICNLNQLISILQYTPHIRRLQCKYLIHFYTDIESQSQLILSRLSYISIANCSLKFDEFETFITKICSQLEVLRITTCSDTAYLDAIRWKQLILQHMPHLHRFDFNHHYKLQFNDYEYNYFSEVINQFSSLFWIERQGIFELKITDTLFIFAIHSCTIWFDSEKHTEVIPIFNQNNNSISSVSQLTIAGSCSAAWHQSVIAKMNPIFVSVRFTRLHINCNAIFTNTFIKLIQLLPGLNSLKLSSFPFLQLSNLSEEDTLNLRLVSVNNKITKMNFQGMNDVEQVCFVLFLCSHLQHLEVRCTKYTNLDILLRCILMASYTIVPHLRSLDFHHPNTNEELVHKLRKLIYLEKLLNNYTLKRFGDNIYLQWK